MSAYNNSEEGLSLSNAIFEIFKPIIKSTVEEVLSTRQFQQKSDEEELSIAQTAEILNISEGHLYNLTSQRAISFFKEGKYTRFYRSEVMAWKNARKQSRKQIAKLNK